MSLKYPFPVMEIGDWFEVPETMKRPVQSAMWKFERRYFGHRFMVKKGQDGVIRCIRVNPLDPKPVLVRQVQTYKPGEVNSLIDLLDWESPDKR